MYSEFLTSSNYSLLSSSLIKNDTIKLSPEHADHIARANSGFIVVRYEQNNPTPVPQSRDTVIIMPLVRASGTGKASSTEKESDTLEMGIKDIPIRSITTASSMGFLKGSERK